MKIILDTSFLIDCFNFRIDYGEELGRLFPEAHELCTLECVQQELSKKLPAALELVKLKKAAVYKEASEPQTGLGPCDSKILAFAESCKGVVCTTDRLLKQQAKEKALRIVTIRQKSHLAEV